MKPLLIICLLAIFPRIIFAQHSNESQNNLSLHQYEDSLTVLGKKFVNDENDLERKNANYIFIKTLVSALKVPNSFLYPFDSVKSINIINSPDNRFRIISWPIVNLDGSYRFYGTVQINTGGSLQMYPLNDFSPDTKNPEDTLTDNRTWFGAEYYRIIPVYSPKLYYVLLGWKGNNVKSTKKVIEVLSFKDNKPVFGLPVFDGNGKIRKRVVFEYNRNVSMLLKYVPDQNLIVFDHLSPPDPKLKNQHDTYGPDLSYDGYRLKNGRWIYVDNLDMRNVSSSQDDNYVDPKKQAQIDRATVKKN
ncbi:MAG: hypothetical protein JWQ84_928 [Mucilaginibacter sp.]|jgi:hypothetical protein|nr:hypothetical protein [Mucilaginibacter sp.]